MFSPVKAVKFGVHQIWDCGFHFDFLFFPKT